MLYIVKYYDSDTLEWAQFEHGNEIHAKQTYEMYKGLDGVTRLHMMAYDMNNKEYKILQ